MKKIRVTVPEDIWRLMKNDVEEFGINNNKLCNYILERFKYNKKMDAEKLLETQGRPVKKIIQFDLNVSNREIYYDVLKANEVDVEAEYFRELFELYTSKFKYQRELFIFEDREFMNEMFPNDLFVDDRKDLTCIWEHEIEEGIDYIDATYFIKNSKGSFDKVCESYGKKIFTSDEMEKAIEESGLKLIKIIENNEIAGRRNVYLLKKMA